MLYKLVLYRSIQAVSQHAKVYLSSDLVWGIQRCLVLYQVTHSHSLSVYCTLREQCLSLYMITKWMNTATPANTIMGSLTRLRHWICKRVHTTLIKHWQIMPEGTSLQDKCRRTQQCVASSNANSCVARSHNPDSCPTSGHQLSHIWEYTTCTNTLPVMWMYDESRLIILLRQRTVMKYHSVTYPVSSMSARVTLDTAGLWVNAPVITSF